MEFWDQVGSVGSVASIVGTIISIYLLFTVRKIKNPIFVSGPDSRNSQSAQENANDLSEQMRQFESPRKHVELILSKVESILKNSNSITRT